MEFQSKLCSVRMEGNKSNKQPSEIGNTINFYKSQEEIIKFYNCYFEMVHKAAYDSKHGKCLKISTLKQMFQRLPIPLAQLKAGYICENLLNEIYQIIYSLYWEKRNY